MFYKKKLLALPELGITGDMERAARNDDGTPEDVHDWHSNYVYQRMRYRYWGYFRADKWDGILRIAIWSKEGVLQDEEPSVIIFLDKENNYTTYIPRKDKWSTASLEYIYQWRMVPGPADGYHWKAGGNYISAKENKLIGKFVASVVGDYKGIGSAYAKGGCRSHLNILKDAREIVYAFQANKLNEERYARHKKETDEIDAVMNQVDDALPEDIESWVLKKGIQRQYGIMKPREKKKTYRKTLCSSCQSFFNVDKEYARVNNGYECPECRSVLTLKDWNRQKALSSADTIFILQNMKDNDGYVIRSFYAKAIWKKDDLCDTYKPCLRTFHENYRKPFGSSSSHELFAWDRYKDGTYRWCYALRRPYTYYKPDIGDGIIYPGNLKQVFASEPWVRLDLEQIFCSYHEDGSGRYTRYVWVESVIRKLIITVGIEYIQKAGLKRLLLETIYGHDAREIVNNSAKSIKDYLQIDGNNLARLKRLNGGYHMLYALQHVQKIGEKVSDETLIYISNRHISITDDLLVLRTGLSLNKAANYYVRQRNKNNWSASDFRTTYSDYLNMAEQRGMDITDDIVRLNKNMKEFHDRYVEELNAKKNREEDAAADRKFKKIRKDYKTNLKRFGYEWKKEGMVIVVPGKASDIKREGRVLHHCVGTRGYIERMNEGKSFIVFLRRKKDIDTPYYTIEVSKEGHIVQFYSAYDRQPDKDKISRLLKKWSKDVKRRADEEFAAIEAKENMKDICREQKLLATA